jgi:hypothetical protein
MPTGAADRASSPPRLRCTSPLLDAWLCDRATCTIGRRLRVAIGHSGVMSPHRVLLRSLATGLLLTGCGSDTGSPAPAMTTVTVAAEPATAEAPAVPPVGKVVRIGNAPEGIVVGTSGIGAVAVRNPDAVQLIDAVTGAVLHNVPMTGAARHLSLAAPNGPVLVPLENSNELCELTLDGRVTATTAGVGRQPHDAAQTAGGTVVVTNELGGGVVFVRGGSVVGSLPVCPVQPGGVASVGDYAAVADVRGNGVWVYDGTARQQLAHGPVGVKLTHAVALSGDLPLSRTPTAVPSSSSASTRSSPRSRRSTLRANRTGWPTTRRAAASTSPSPGPI